jgi:anti-sigma-K factor RskA
VEKEKNKELLSAHALEALDAEERREIDALLTNDEDLRAEFEEWRDAAALLSYAAPAAEPAPEVRSRILEKIRQTPQEKTPQSTPTPRKFSVIEGKGAPKTVASPTAAMTNSGASQNSFWRLLPGIAAIAASVVALVLAFSLYRAVQNNQARDAELAALGNQLNEARQKINETEQLLARERQERDLLASPSSAIAELTGADTAAPSARARLVFDKQTGRAVLFVEGLPEAPRGKAYQIWWISDPQHPAPGGVFNADASGKAVLRDQIPSENLKAKAFAVTLEDANGSPVPKGSFFLKSSAL